MFGGVNPRQMQQMMKKMGISQEEIPAEEVIIKTADKEIVISNPTVVKVKMSGKQTFQIDGEVSERSKEAFSKDDVDMIVAQAGCSEEQAKEALASEGDIAKAILKLKG
jgi:nascent polypeptide-associated complex subunit alpha